MNSFSLISQGLPLAFDDTKVIQEVLTSVMGIEMLTLLSSLRSMLKYNRTTNYGVRIKTKISFYSDHNDFRCLLITTKLSSKLEQQF